MVIESQLLNTMNDYPHNHSMLLAMMLCFALLLDILIITRQWDKSLYSYCKGTASVSIYVLLVLPTLWHTVL